MNSIYHKISGRKTTILKYWENISTISDIRPRGLRHYNLLIFHIQKLNKSKITSLEIGAGAADFSRSLISNYSDSIVHVIEPNPIWKEFHKRFHINPIDSFFPSTHVQNNMFDIVNLSHVLEHILDYTAFLNSIRSCLKDTGFFIIDVPNCKSSYWKQDTNDGPHLNFFNLKSLKLLIESHGFQLLESHDEFSLLAIFKAI